MQTDNEGNMIFRSLKGGLFYFSMVLLLSVVAAAVFMAVYFFLKGMTWLSLVGLIIAAAFVIICFAIVLTVNSLRFVLEKDGVRVPNSMLLTGVKIQAFIPYPMISKFYGTTRILAPAFSPVSSSDAVMIVFTNDNGRRGDMVAVSPEEKELFISELTKRTGIGVSDDPHAKKR